MELMNQIDAKTITELKQGANQLPFLIHFISTLNATAKSANSAIQTIQPAVDANSETSKQKNLSSV
ncbi:MAG: hypothetical protein COA78_04955 [Blastopirellula sp.]|nr:MAG: hypothetical protein COA78_04955 [Blastopirellula sp.]